MPNINKRDKGVWDMRILRTFHPVGQGAFYSERFYDSRQRDSKYNIVFDCGVCLGKESTVKHVVKQNFTDSDEIDYLFVSHLDYDHVSLAYNIVSKAKNIVLPLVSEEHLVIAMLYYIIEDRNEMVTFFQEVIDRLGRRNDNGSVIFIGGDDVEPDMQKNVIKSGTEIPKAWDSEWVFIPRNVNYRSRREELKDELGKVLIDSNFENAIKGFGIEPIGTADELIKKLKDKDLAKIVLKIPVLRKTIKKAYEKIEGGTNENSLLLYSGPKYEQTRYRLMRCTHRSSWGYCDNRRAACLYTGDSTCNMVDWQTMYSSVWGLIGTIQLPHHGSVDSFDVATTPIDREYTFPVSFGTYNMYGHPSGKVLAYLQVCDCCVPLVTEMANSGYMQKIGKY